MNFTVLTLFPELIDNAMNTSICKRAMEKGYISLDTIDIRDFAENKNGRVDDYTYGGGAGMLMQAGPVYSAYKEACRRLNKEKAYAVYMTPQGRVFNQRVAEELAQHEDLVIICGHYEGIDERALEEIGTDNISIGDYVLTGGEIASLAVMDCVSRLVPEYSEMKHQHPTSRSRVKGCLNIRSIPDLKYGMTEKCLMSCFRDIMPISKNGDMNSR